MTVQTRASLRCNTTKQASKFPCEEKIKCYEECSAKFESFLVLSLTKKQKQEAL